MAPALPLLASTTTRGRNVDKTPKGKRGDFIAKGRAHRREQVHAVFERLRHAVHDEEKRKAILASPAGQRLTDLANAFEAWLNAGLPALDPENPGAGTLLLDKLYVFLRTYRGLPMGDPFLILRSDPKSGEELHEIGLHIEGLVMVFKAPFVGVGSQRRSDAVTEHFWEEKRPEGAARVVVVDDTEIPARYCYVRSSDDKHEHAVWKNLKFLLPIVQTEELKDDARQPDSDSGALPRLALALDASVFDEEAFRLIIQGLESQDSEIGTAAAMAAMILKWKKFLPALRDSLS